MIVSNNPDVNNPLWDFFNNKDHRVIHKWTNYFDIYLNHFSRYVGTDITFVEIGVYLGGSLQMWKNFFGPRATIVGIDIQERCKEYEEDQIHIHIGDQSDHDFLDSILDKYDIDILLDDGGHVCDAQVTTFEHMFHKISPEGIYMVEDTHTNYWDSHGGGLKKEGTFIEHSKNLIDTLHGMHNGTRNEFTDSTTGMHFYDSIVAFEKRKSQTAPQNLMMHEWVEV